MFKFNNIGTKEKIDFFLRLSGVVFIALILFGALSVVISPFFQNNTGTFLLKQVNNIEGQQNIDRSELSRKDLDDNIDFKVFWDAWDALYKNYVDRGNLKAQDLFYGAIKGMVDAAGDPYTVFFDPKLTKEFNSDLAGTFDGIGAEIGMKDKVITVVAPLPDTPASKTGLMAGDKILSINDESTANMTVDEAVSKIRGQKGTPVDLSIYREGFLEAKTFTIIRDTIQIKSAQLDCRPDNICILKITNFNEDISATMNELTQELVKKNPSGIILDLRNDPGGYLSGAVDVASEWIESGVIVSEEFSKDAGTGYNKNTISHEANGRSRLKFYPTVVLVNKGSASASEIVAGALKDYGVAKIVGETTFGKGSVQELIDLKDGSSLKVTVAKWLTPKGNYIHDTGIAPDIQVELTYDDYNSGKDPQLDKALEILKQKNNF